MTVHTPQPGQPVIELWTYFVVDPVGVPLSRRLARMRVVTPNRLTALALALGIAAAACFATGRLRIGGALFLLRFFVDCLDGTVARIQGSCSKRGAYFDLGADVIGVTAGFAALGWYLVDSGRLDLAWLLALLGTLGLYNWVLDYRKRVAADAGLGNGGASHQCSPSWAPLRRWVTFCNSRGVSTVPWARRWRSRHSAWRRCCCRPTSCPGRSSRRWPSTSSPTCSMPGGSGGSPAISTAQADTME